MTSGFARFNLRASMLTVAIGLSASVVVAQQAVQVQGQAPDDGWRSEAQFSAGLSTPVEIPMADGAVLRGDVTYPIDKQTGQRATGPFPVILEFTPYKFASVPSLAPYGYISARINNRGSQKSDGEWQGWMAGQDGKDGAEVVRWASKVDGSTGTVGITGCSAPGLRSWDTAAAVGPGSPLKAVISADSVGNYYGEQFFSNGVPTQLSYFMDDNFVGLLGPTPSSERMLRSLFGAKGAIVTGGKWAYDVPGTMNDHESDRTTRQIFDAGMPVLLWSGYHAIAKEGMLRRFTRLQNLAAGADSLGMPAYRQGNPKYQIIVNDGGHCQNIDTYVQVRWFDTWLKGARTGMSTTNTPLHMLELPTKQWVNGKSVVFAERYTSMRLAAGGKLLGGASAGAGGTVTLAFTDPGAPHGVAAFQTQPLDKDMVIAGPMSLTAYASSSSSNLHLIATVEDVAPDGSVAVVSQGNIVGSLSRLVAGRDAAKSWRNMQGLVINPYLDISRDRYLRPGAVQRFDIPIDPIVWRVQQGHSVRVRLTTRMPEGGCRLGLGTDPCHFTPQQLRSLPGTYTIHFGRAHPSQINLPIVPASRIRYTRSGMTPTSGKGGGPVEAGGTATQPLDW